MSPLPFPAPSPRGGLNSPSDRAGLCARALSPLGRASSPSPAPLPLAFLALSQQVASQTVKTRPPSFSMGTFQGTPSSFSPMTAASSTASPTGAAYPNLASRSTGFSECGEGLGRVGSPKPARGERGVSARGRPGAVPSLCDRFEADWEKTPPFPRGLPCLVARRWASTTALMPVRAQWLFLEGSSPTP